MRWMRRRVRITTTAAVMLLIAVTPALATAGAASAAEAAPAPVCPPGVQWFPPLPGQSLLGMWTGYQYVVDSETPDFLVSQQLLVDNHLGPVAITGSFSSTVSHTFSLTVTVGTSASLYKTLTASISSSITMSTTTTAGVTATAPVPAYSTVIGQYGVQAYDVTYTANYYAAMGGPLCYPDGSQQGPAVAPTGISGWRVIPGGAG